MGRKNKNKSGNTHNVSEEVDNVEDTTTTTTTTTQQQAEVADQPMEKEEIIGVEESAPATADPQQSSENNGEKVAAEEEPEATAAQQEEQVDTNSDKKASDEPEVEETTAETENNTITNTTEAAVNKEEKNEDQTEEAHPDEEEDKKKETSSYVSEENKSSNSNNNTVNAVTTIAATSEDDQHHQPEDALNKKADDGEGEGEGEKQDVCLSEEIEAVPTDATTETKEDKVEDDQHQVKEEGDAITKAASEGEEKEEENKNEAAVEESPAAFAEEEAPADSQEAEAHNQEQEQDEKEDENEKASANVAVEEGVEEKEPTAAEDESTNETPADAAAIDEVAEEAAAESGAENKAEQSAEADNQQHDHHEEENNNEDQDQDRDDEEAEEIDELVRPEVTPVPIVDDNAAVVPEIDEAVHFTEDERRFITSDLEAIEKSTTEAERAVRQRTADLRKALFTSKALRRLAATRASEARAAAAIEGDVDVSAVESSSSAPSSSDTMRLAKALGEKATTVETEAAQLEADIANYTARKAKLVHQYHGSLEVLFALDRFEKFLTQLAEHVKSRQNFAAKPQGAEVEESVLVRIRELTEKRNAELTRLEAMKERIKKTAAELRKGHVVERQPKIPSIAGNNGIATNAATTAAMLNNPLIGQRSSVAREDASTAVDADQEVTELREFNAVVGKEVETLNDVLHRLTKERTALAAKLSLTKVSVRKQEANLNDELKQKSLRLRADTKAIEDLHRTNAALISTIETLMHQLNNEYYGAGDRPAIASTKAAGAGGSNAAAGASGSGAPRMIAGTKRLAAAPKTAAAIEDKKGPASPAPRRK